MYYNEERDINDSFKVLKTCSPLSDSNLEELNVNEMDLSKKSIVILCGNNTRDPMRARLYASYCLNWLNNCSDRNQITVYSVFYPKDQPLLNTFNPNTSLNYDILAETMFEQVLSKNNKQLPVDEVIKKLNNIVFFGHSAGGYVMNELMYGFGKMLDARNFSPEEILKIYESIVFIGYSPFGLVEAPIKTIYVAPIYDSLGSTKRVYDKMVQDKDFVTLNTSFKIQKSFNINADTYSDFFHLYESILGNEDTIYFANKNTLISTPNLLFSDEKKEDHNLAGVIDYPVDNPHKTEAGKLTTQFFHQVFEYCFSSQRENFNTRTLFQKISSADEPNIPDKET